MPINIAVRSGAPSNAHLGFSSNKQRLQEQPQGAQLHITSQNQRISKPFRLPWVLELLRGLMLATLLTQSGPVKAEPEKPPVTAQA